MVDSSQWDQTGFIKVASLEGIDTLITDKNLPAKARTAIERLGVHVVLV